jgi:hypothetical protein
VGGTIKGMRKIDEDESNKKENKTEKPRTIKTKYSDLEFREN